MPNCYRVILAFILIGVSAVTGRAGKFMVETDPETGWSVYELRQGESVARVVPAAGLNVASLKVSGHEVLRPAPALRDLAGVGYGVPILYPSPNRVRGAAFRVGERELRFPANDGSNFIHGLVHSVPWEVVGLQVDDQSASLTAQLRFGAAEPPLGLFPLPHVLQVKITLSEGQLRWTYTVDNRQGREPVPFGFALHPYFNYLADRPQTTIMIPATHAMEAERLLPTGRLLPLAGHPLDARQPTSLAQLHADDVFFGLDGQTPTVVRYGDTGVELKLAASPEFTHVVLYTPDAPFFCVENQTCATDAHNLAAQGQQREAHLQTCPVGETLSGWVEYSVTTPPKSAP